MGSNKHVASGTYVLMRKSKSLVSKEMKMNIVFFVRSGGRVVVFLVLYVDDIILIRNGIPTLNSVKAWFGKSFIIKELGEAAYVLGIKIYRDRSR